MKHFSTFLGIFIVFLSNNLWAEKLFQYQKKTYTTDNLPPMLQSKLNDLNQHYFDNYQRLVDNYLLDLRIEELAKKNKSTVEKTRESVLGNIKITDKEANEWYTQNKQRVGNRKYEEIKKEIKMFLKQQKNLQEIQKLVQEVKDNKSFKSLLTPPPAFVVDINTNNFPSKGKDNAKVTIVEFADYQCPHCKHASNILKKIMTKYQDKVKLVYIDFPINRSGISRKIAEGAACAREQNKYWEYHEMAFDKQAELSQESPMQFANNLKLDTKRFTTCLASEKTKNMIDEAKKEGMRIGVGGTPSIYINGKKISNHEESEMTKAIEEVL